MTVVAWRKTVQNQFLTPFAAHISSAYLAEFKLHSCSQKNPENGMSLAEWGIKTDY